MTRLERVLTRRWAVTLAVAVLIALPVIVLGEVAANDASRQARADEIRITATTAARAADLASARVFAVRDQLIAMHATLYPSPTAQDRRVPAATIALQSAASAPTVTDAAAAAGIEVLREYRSLLGRDVTQLAFSWAGLAPIAEPPGDSFVLSYARTRSEEYLIQANLPGGGVGVSQRPTPSYSNVYRSKGEGPAIAVATAVANVGVSAFAAELDLRDLRVALAAVLPERGDIYVIDRAGLLIAHGSATQMAVLTPAKYVPRAGTAGEAIDPVTGAQRLVASAAVDQLRWTVVVARDAVDAASAAADQARALRIALVVVLIVGSYIVASATSVAIRRRRLLATANAELTAATAAKSKFLASMSHELRTPMNSIIGFTDVLLEGIYGPLNAEQRSSLGYVSKGGHDLLALVNDVLDLSKIEAERIELTPERFAPLDLVQEVLAQLGPIAAADRTTLVRRDEHAPAEIHADRGRVRQIVTNLVSNAVKFAKGGEIGVTVSGAGDRVAIAVRDTGRGVPAAQHEAIFEEFRQARADDEGTGLGLPISRRLARLMGGDITLESEEGRGSTFTLTLPLEAKLPASQRVNPGESDVLATHPGVPSA